MNFWENSTHHLYQQGGCRTVLQDLWRATICEVNVVQLPHGLQQDGLCCIAASLEIENIPFVVASNPVRVVKIGNIQPAFRIENG